MPLRGADPSLWYCMPGVVAAYQPISAPDTLSARRNMAMGGQARYWATPGTAPTWASRVGWSFDGVTQYLTTGIVPADSYSMLVCVSGVTNDGVAIGEYVADARMELSPRPWFSTVYGHGGAIVTGNSFTDGVLAVSNHQGYKSGIADGGTIGAWTGGAAVAMYIGDRNGSPSPMAGNIAAIAVCTRWLTAAEIWSAAQQMQYCHINAAWNVWAPQRRWFILPPPAPAAATPVLATIYINSADIGDTSLFDDVSGAAVSSTYARTGTYSFKLDGADYVQANLTSSATKYTKFGLLVTATPASDALLCAWQETGTEHVSLYLTDKLTLQMRQGSTIIQTSPTTLELATWYCVEAKVVVHTTTGRFQVRIDGVDDMSAIGINTDADVDGTINEIRFEAPVDDTYIDDIVVREDQWCGVGGVYVIVPTAAGTVEEWSGAYTDVDDLPPAFTDYINATAESGVDQVFRHGEMTGDYDIGIVGVFAKGRLDSAAVDTVFNALARVNTTDHAGSAQDLDTIGVYARVLMTTNPDGSVAWTTHAVNNALQIGART